MHNVKKSRHKYKVIKPAWGQGVGGLERGSSFQKGNKHVVLRNGIQVNTKCQCKSSWTHFTAQNETWVNSEQRMLWSIFFLFLRKTFQCHRKVIYSDVTQNNQSGGGGEHVHKTAFMWLKLNSNLQCSSLHTLLQLESLHNDPAKWSITKGKTHKKNLSLHMWTLLFIAYWYSPTKGQSGSASSTGLDSIPMQLQVCPISVR